MSARWASRTESSTASHVRLMLRAINLWVCERFFVLMQTIFKSFLAKGLGLTSRHPEIGK
jgi:hypothetical protein